MEPLSDREIASLTKALKRGNEDAWRRFHQHYAHRLAAFVHQTTSDPDIIPDILQDILCRCVRNIKKYTSEEYLWCWLTRVARSACTDHYRKKSRYEQALQKLVENNIPEPLPNLEPHLQSLTKTSRILLEEKYFHGYTVKEIARKHSSTPKKIAHALDRARSALRQILTP